MRRRKPGGWAVGIHSVVGALYFCLAGGISAVRAEGLLARDKVVSYIMRPDDSLYNIAEHYLHRRDDWAMVARLNHVSMPERLQTGRTLRLPVALLKKHALSVAVLTVNGPASYARHGAAFTPLAPGMVLAEGDQVKTGNNGFVTLELPPDKSHLVVTPGSLLRMSTLRQTVLTGAVDRVLSLQQGGVDSAVTPLRGRDDRFQIRSPSVTAGVRGTHFQMHLTHDGATNIEVLKGAVSVDDRAAHSHAHRHMHHHHPSMQLVTALHGNVSEADGMVGMPHMLLSAPDLINPWVQDKPDVHFYIRSVNGARYYRVGISHDANMFDRILDVNANNTHVVIGPLPNGHYFVRVAAVDANGLEGIPGIYRFERHSACASSATDRQG